MTEEFQVPYLDYTQIVTKTQEFLKRHHPSGEIPIPIEEIVEFGLGINIVPLPGLHQTFEIDGFTSSDLKEISVDLAVFETRPKRFRFTLAHEVGHLVMHRELFQTRQFSTVSEWKNFIQDFPLKEWGYLETQANNFAGALLVPSDPLRIEYAKTRRRVEGMGVSFDELTDVAWDFVCQGLGDVFDVSKDVVRIRLEKEKLKQE